MYSLYFKFNPSQSKVLSANVHVWTARRSPELSEDGGAELESEEELCGSRSSLERQGHRGNTTVHVCWHRNTSVSMVDFSVAVEVPGCVSSLLSCFSPHITSHFPLKPCSCGVQFGFLSSVLALCVLFLALVPSSLPLPHCLHTILNLCLSTLTLLEWELRPLSRHQGPLSLSVWFAGKKNPLPVL